MDLDFGLFFADLKIEPKKYNDRDCILEGISQNQWIWALDFF